MTVSNQTSVVQYNGNGATVTWPTGFRFFKNTDLVVTKRSAAGVTTLLTLNTDYSVTGGNALGGGNVVTTNALATGELLTIARVLTVQQLTDLRNQGDYFAEIHEDVFDYLTMLIQQTGESDSRALRHPRDSEHYQAEARRIVDLEDPVNAQDATTKNWVSSYFAALIDAASGVVNTTLGILYDAGTLFDYLRFGVQRSVDTYAALQALSPSRNMRAKTLGYWAIGDGGHGDYFYNGTAWQLIHNGTVNVRQFGARGDGATDDHLAFQAALDFAKAVYVPSAPNGYRLTAQISMNQSGGVLFGDGPSQSSYINVAAHTFDVIKVNAFNVVIRDLGFQNFTTPAFSAPRFWTIINDNMPGTSVLNIVTYGMHSGVSMGAVGSTAGGSVSRLRNLILSTLGRGTGIGIQYGGQAEIREMTDIFMSGTGVGTVAANNAFAGVNILGGVGLVMHNVHLTGCGTPMRIAPPAGAAVNHVKITESWFDSSSASGLELNGTAGGITDVQMSQIWASGCGAGVNILGYARDVIIDGIECYQNQAGGISIADNASVAGLIIQNANISGNAGAGVSFGANTSGWKVLNSNIGQASFAGANLYGIFINPGCDGYVMSGCDIRGNTSGQIVGHAGMSPTKRVNDVIGYPTQNMGGFSATTDSNGAFSLPHGLGKTPNYVSMQPVGGAISTALVAQFVSHDPNNLNGKLFNNGTPAASVPFTVFWEVKF